MSRQTVQLGERTYDVALAPSFRGLARHVHAQRVIVVTDSTVGPLWGAALEEELERDVVRVTLPAGEQNKTAEVWLTGLDAVLRAAPDRKTPIIALGGGVVGDMAGFMAAAALRGLPFIQVPTTLLAMVDSSVGGKTAINHATGKNRIGAFYQPTHVWAALDTLTTLDPDERRAGLGEVLKTALIAGDALWEHVESHAEALRDGDVEATRVAVQGCVREKARVVAQDERESGLRAVLNAGHTVGHALERALGYGMLRHGEAVAVGLVWEARYAEAEGICKEADLSVRIADVSRRLGLPTTAPPTRLADRVQAAVMDKKAVGDKVRVPLPVGVGQFEFRDLEPVALATLMGDDA